MSAFIVDKAHIDALVTAGLTPDPPSGSLSWYVGDEPHKLTRETANDVGDMLLRENVRSVSHRYPDDGPLPGPIDQYWIEPYRFQPIYHAPTPVEALAAIGCYIYQACEHPEWHESEARIFCDALRDRCVRRLPGYSDAPYEWTEAMRLAPRHAHDHRRSVA